MSKVQVGLDDIGIYLPPHRVTLDTIYRKRVEDDPSQVRKLAKAIDSTGQRAIRFPGFHEDSGTMAANSALTLLKRQDQDELKKIRHLAAATETSLDFSKPLSNYVMGMLQTTGITFPSNILTWQTQHACAAGTIAMMNIVSQLVTGGRPEEKGMVLCSDIARYDAPSSAEITQGAGAVSLLIAQSPQLVSIDLENQGFASADVDDFFRPLDSPTPRVKGRYSMQCYNEAANGALQDYCDRSGMTPQEALTSHDYYVFHVPFAKMAYTAARSLLSQYLHLVDGEVDDFLGKRGFFKPLELTADTGNIYTGAAFLNLASLLWEEYKVKGKDIVGKKILFSSYGSGNTMIVLSLTVMEGAPEIISRWDLDSLPGTAQDVDFQAYQDWIDKDWTQFNTRSTELQPPRGFYLSSIREDGYRIYAVSP